MNKALKKPVGLQEAADILAKDYPEWAFSARELRQMCDTCAVDRVLRPVGGLSRKVMYLVRVEELLATFSTWERKATLKNAR